MRVEAETARSRFTGEEGERAPRFVRRRVSGDTPTLKEVGVKEVRVRQVPADDLVGCGGFGIGGMEWRRTVDAYAIT